MARAVPGEYFEEVGSVGDKTEKGSAKNEE